MTPATQSRLIKGIVYLLLGTCLLLLTFTGILSRSKQSSKDVAAAPVPPTREPGKTSGSRAAAFSWPLPAASVSDDELLRLARQYVTISPQQAIAWAGSATDEGFRERLLFATARAWGEQHPLDATDWALVQDEKWRFKRMEAVLLGAVAQPDAALAIGKALFARDAASGSAYDTALVADFIAVHQFQKAVQLAGDASGDVQRQWLQMIYQRWAAEAPRQAFESLNSFTNGALQPALFQAAAAGWANNDPAGLAQYAEALPASDSRSNALNMAFDQWLNRDPVEMGEWLNTLPANAETDAAVAKLITRTDEANRSTEVAIGWVEQIQDLDLRATTLEHVLSEWARSDLEGARKYLDAESWLTPEKRQGIWTDISTPRDIDGRPIAANGE